MRSGWWRTRAMPPSSLVLIQTRIRGADSSQVTAVKRQPTGHLATLVSGLRNRAFRKLWLSQVASEVGDWAARLALTTVVYARTGSATWAALITVSGLLPMLGPGQMLATIADRVDRRVVLVTADVLRALVFGVLALTTPATPVLLAVSVLTGLATVPFEAARSAATLDVTPEDQLPAAMSLGQATQSLALVVGWGVGGLLLVGVGAHGAFAVNACTFAMSAALLSRLPSLRHAAVDDETHVDAPLSAGRRLVAAAQAVSNEPLVRRAALVAVLAVGPATAAEALIVPFVSRTWSSHPSLAAALLAAGAALDLLLTVAIRCTLPPEQLLRIAAWCSAAPATIAVLLFSTGSPVLSAAGFVVSSMTLTAIAPASAALAPRLPARMRASCFTILATALTLTQVVLSTAGGALADAFGTTVAARALMLFQAVAGLAAVLSSAPRAVPELEPAH